MQVAGAAKAEPRLACAGAGLSRVVDDEHRDVVLALQLAQVGEDGGDLLGRVLVDAMRYKWIEDEKARSPSGDGLDEAPLVVEAIEPEARREDRVDREILELESALEGEAFEPLADRGGRVLGGEQEDRPSTRDREGPECGRPGCDG